MNSVPNLNISTLRTQGLFHITNGRFTLGSRDDHNVSLRNARIAAGSAYTQGQKLRSYKELNNNGDFVQNPTTNDEDQIRNAFSGLITLYPNLNAYPFLYPLRTILWSDFSTVITNSLDRPIYLYNARGLSNSIVWHNNSPTVAPSSCTKLARVNPAGYYFSENFQGQLYLPKPEVLRTRDAPKYPYNGYTYSGQLVQYLFDPQQPSNDNEQPKTVVYTAPFQLGRGIPQYNPNNEYFAGNAFGTPVFNDVVLTPMLSVGCNPGNNNYCAGVALDSFFDEQVSAIFYNRNATELADTVFGFPSAQTRPAPFTTGPRNVSFTTATNPLSPENSAGYYWAPWPQYYAYPPNDPVPIQEEGLTCVRIGAATNIGMQAYYEPDVAPGDDPINNPNYVAVSTVPLFQGEQVLVGSNVYATCRGHIITGDPVGESPYLPASYLDAAPNDATLFDVLVGVPFLGVQRKGFQENPWYDYYDPTYGSVGWTSTPAFLLSYIPDEGVAILATRDGSTTLPYLHMANQGSLIVQATSTQDPLSESGSGRKRLLGEPTYGVDNRLTKFPNGPERSLCIGNTFQTFRGTGQWTYTGTVLDFDQTANTFAGGIGYSVDRYDTIGGTGSGLTVDVTSVDANGTILTVVLNSSGSGYTDGDLLTIVDSSARNDLFGENAFNYYANCATVVFTTGPNAVTLTAGGSGYTSEIEVEGYNLSANNLIVSATAAGYTFSEFGFYTILTTAPTQDLLPDPERYPYGTRLRVYTANAAKNDLAVVEVTDNDGATVTLAFPADQIITSYMKRGSNNIYDRGTFLYNTQLVNQVNPRLRITADANGQITGIAVVDFGENNRNGDIILINTGDRNCLFTLDNDTANIVTFSSKLHSGGVGYYHNSFFFADALTVLSATTPTYLQTNDVTVVNSGVSTGATGKIGRSYSPTGQVTNFFYDPPVAVVSNGFTGEVYDTNTLLQVYPFNLATQPGGAGAQPATGWPSYVYRDTATYAQYDLVPFVKIAGTGYTKGEYATTGGSGTGLRVYITEVTSTGGVVDVVVTESSVVPAGYLYNETLVVSGGGNDCEIVLKLPPTQEITFRYFEFATTPGVYYLASVLLFDYQIVNGGTGYVVGGPFTTTCAVYATNAAVNLTVNILDVDPISGAILDLETATVDNVEIAGYQIDYTFVINAGNSDCVIRLVKPRAAQRVTFTSGGTGYTLGTYTTYNVSANNYAGICGLETTGPGECEVIDYGASDPKPSFWDLSRYTVGDILAFDQDGNQSATAEILTIDNATHAITFNQLTVGTGYVQPVTSMYGILPTVNTSLVSTTVDVTSVDPNTGAVTGININTLGTGTRYGDFLVVESGNNNCVIRIQSEKDVPAPSQPFVNGRAATPDEWNGYKTVMKSAVNLLDRNCLFNLKRGKCNFYNNSYYFYGDPDNKDPYRGVSYITF
jgi:hypothetical protein